ncbi:type VII secretion protein EssA [Listeria costaricensis]|uniref:type VII secretion protein EssA n=1 Tax=Listeria costaricensis TaxID=2026604 RepID=UPI001F08FDED|nr:type VII secretion protein EssA [Listeria costaricensis]
MKRKQIMAVGALGLLAAGFILPLAATADSYLDNNGEMELQTSRLQLSEEEKNKQMEEQTETTFDQLGIPLFTDQMDKEIADEKKVEEKQLENLESELFTGDSEKGATAKQAKADLFDETSTAASSTTTSSSSGTETTATTGTEEGTKKKTVGGILGGAVLAIGAGIYAACRNVFE